MASARAVLDELYRRVHQDAFDLATSLGWVRLHAAVVDFDDQRVVFVGPSGIGKTTLACALVLAGVEVPADESVFVRDGSALPVARRFHLKPGLDALLPDVSALAATAPTLETGTRAWDPRTAGMRWTIAERAVGAVVVLQPRGQLPGLRPVSATATMPAITAEALRTREPVAAVIAELATLLDRAPVFELTPGSPTETLPLLTAVGYDLHRASPSARRRT